MNSKNILASLVAMLCLLSATALQARSGLTGDSVHCHDNNLRACGNTNDVTAIVGPDVEFNEGGIVQVDVAARSITFANGRSGSQNNGGNFQTTISDLDFVRVNDFIGIDFEVSGITRNGNPLTSDDIIFTGDSVTFDWNSTVWQVGSYATVTFLFEESVPSQSVPVPTMPVWALVLTGFLLILLVRRRLVI